MTRHLLFLLALMGSVNLLAAENCSQQALDLPGESKEKILFYEGTCYFRNEDFREAAIKWEELINNQEVSGNFHEFFIKAHNNLGYLYFFGKGVPENQGKAIEHWKYAVANGHIESEYHLCHAYANRSKSTYEPVRAMLHCRKAEMLYGAMEDRSPSGDQILTIVSGYLDELENQY